MRYGMCTNMVAGVPGGTGAEVAQKLAKMGYDYIEMPLAELMSLPEPDFIKIKNTLKSLNLDCEAFNNFFPRTFRLTGPEADHKKAYEYVSRAFDRAAQIKGQVVVFGSGMAKWVPEGFPHEKAFEQLASLLCTIDGLAKQYGITIAIEPLRKPECNIINTYAEGCRLAQAVNLKSVKVLADYYHIFYEEDDMNDLVTNAKWLEHLHFACPYRPHRGERTFPDPMDGWNYDGFISAVKRSGFNNRISLEAYTNNFDLDAKIGLDYLKIMLEG